MARTTRLERHVPETILTDEEYRKYLDDLMHGRRAACAAIVEGLLERRIGLTTIYLGLFQRSLYDVGAMWERNDIPVAVEHLAAAITDSIMGVVYPTLFRSSRVDRKAVIACVENEYHQIGARMVADIFELHGWDSFFLGANTPTADIIDMIGRTDPDIVGLSLAVRSGLPPLRDAIDRIRERFPEVRVIVGGQAFRAPGADSLLGRRGVAYIPSVKELESLIAIETPRA